MESISALKNATKDTHGGNMLNCLRNLGEERGVPSHSLCVCVCRVRSSSSSSSRDWFVTHSRKCQEPLIGWPSTSLSPFHSLRELYIASSLLVSHSVSFSPLLPCLECGVVCVYIAWTFSFSPLASLPNRIIADPTSSSRKSPIYIYKVQLVLPRTYARRFIYREKKRISEGGRVGE